MKLTKEQQIDLITSGLRKAEELVEQYMPKDTFTKAERDAFRSVALDTLNAKEIYRRSIENE